ncbi:MAG: hypothetical protein HYZ15_13955 [Sphingobacteriales bacterium]|nr:hypothetical protein [Sphingobacteriales bacterium]
MHNSLKAAVLVPPHKGLPAWEAVMLQQALGEGLLQDIVFLAAPEKKAIKGSLVYRLYKKFEDHWFRTVPDAFSITPVKELFPAAPVLNAGENNPANTDLLFRSCLTDPAYHPGPVPPMGIWSIRLGNGAYEAAALPAFGEVMNDEPVTGSSLWVQFPGQNNALKVYDGYSNTVPYSIKNNLCVQAWKASTFLAYRLKELLSLGKESFIKKYSSAMQSGRPGLRAYAEVPGNLRMAALIIRNAWRYLRYKRKSKFQSQRFTLLFQRGDFNGHPPDLGAFTVLEPPAGCFWADPFVSTAGNEHYLFFEEFSYSRNKAHISLLKLDASGKFSKPEIVLDKPYHLAYPFLFCWQDEHYMIPDTSANHTVELYKATRFPRQWELQCLLLKDTLLIDPTLWLENDTWWLFGCAAGPAHTSTNDQLLLYYSRDLLSGNWTPHPQNPVVTHIAGCRPAGKIFRMNGQLFRPAQNNASSQYGYALALNRITLLSETEYREEMAWSLLPGKENNLRAVHTLNFSAGIIVADGIPRK